MKDCCRVCGRGLTPDEIAVTKKLVNRGASEFFCADCLAVLFDVAPADIRERIAYFKQTGCTLFAPPDAAMKDETNDEGMIPCDSRASGGPAAAEKP